MARKAAPWYWPERNAWFTIQGGRRHFLGVHPADLPPPRRRKGKWVVPDAINIRFHALLATPESAPAASAAVREADDKGLMLSELLDKFLAWTRNNKSPRTYEWYRDHLQGFLNHLGRDIPASDLRPFHVVEWADSHPTWSPAYRRGAIVAVQRPYNWAEELGYISSSPVKRIRKPQSQRRESHLTPDAFAELLSHYPEGDPFRDLLLFAWFSGSRPQEAAHVEARHVQIESTRIVIPQEEAKGKRRNRVILLHGPALEVVQKRLLRGSPGKLFVNERGKPWTRFAIANRFDRYLLADASKRLMELGIDIQPLPRFNPRQFADPAKLSQAREAHRRDVRERRKRIMQLARQHGSKIAAYDLRHGFCQRLLESGANHLAVAELMGHASGRIVTETYSHMNRATAHLKETLMKAAGGAGV